MRAAIPRLGFDFFFMQATVRFTHNRDIVPSLPPMWVGFHHVATEIWQVDFGIAHVSSSSHCVCRDSGVRYKRFWNIFDVLDSNLILEYWLLEIDLPKGN